MGSAVSATLDVFGMGPASIQADATTDAARIGANASAAASAAQERMFNKQLELQEPWRKAGEQALNKLIPLTDYTKFGMSEFTADPGYAFRLSEGQKALERSAAARGGLISGSALKAATRYGQDMGSQEYTNAFNRYQTERAAQLQPLQSLAGVGQTAANTLGNAAGAYGAAMGNIAMTGGANAANAALMGGNIRASQYGTIGNALSNNAGAIKNWWNSSSDPYVASRTNAINSGYSEYDA
jgi:hypothetical protein